MKRLLTLLIALTVVFWAGNVFAAAGDPVLSPVVDAEVDNDITITNISQVQDITATASEINTPLDGALVTLTEFQELETIGDVTISANQWAVLGGIAETLTSGELDILDGATLSVSDLNIIDGISDSGTLTAAELLYVDGVTSAIQTQLDALGAGSFGAFTAITIASDIATIGSSNFINLAGEGAAADDLTELVGCAVGDVIVLQNSNAGSYTITVKDGTYMLLQGDFLLDNIGDTITLICTIAGANETMAEITRSSAG